MVLCRGALAAAAPARVVIQGLGGLARGPLGRMGNSARSWGALNRKRFAFSPPNECADLECFLSAFRVPPRLGPFCWNYGGILRRSLVPGLSHVRVCRCGL